MLSPRDDIEIISIRIWHQYGSLAWFRRLWTLKNQSYRSHQPTLLVDILNEEVSRIGDKLRDRVAFGHPTEYEYRTVT